MSTAARRKSNLELLADAQQLSETMVGEVIDGELYVMGRPAPAHQQVEVELHSDLRRGGPGRPPPSGWYFQQEVEIRFESNESAVPDVVGWRTQRIAGHRNDNPITIVPDWVCEILSDSTRRKDLGPKRDLFARHAVGHLWLIDPASQVLEAFQLENGRWSLLGTWCGSGVITGVEPFSASSFDLSNWWLTP